MYIIAHLKNYISWNIKYYNFNRYTLTRLQPFVGTIYYLILNPEFN